MRTKTVYLTYAGLNRAADWLENYAKVTLPNRTVRLVKRLTQEGESLAMNSMGHIDTGLTLTTIKGVADGNHGTISAGGNSVWIEFGTGVYAEGQTDHPLLGQIEGIVPHGAYQYGHGANPHGWFYPDPNGTHFYAGQYWSHTFGIPSNPFMYNTAKTLHNDCAEVAREVFER